MTLVERIQEVYPAAQPGLNFRLVDRGDGVRFKFWELYDDDGNLVPGPSTEELRAWQSEASVGTFGTASEPVSLAPGELLTYKGLADDPQLIGHTIYTLDFSRDLEGAPGYPVVVPETGLYEVVLRLYAYTGSTTTTRGWLDVTRGDATTREQLGEMYFYSNIPFHLRHVLRLEEGDSLKALVNTSGGSYPKRVVGDWSRLRTKADDHPLSTLLIRKAKQ